MKLHCMWASITRDRVRVSLHPLVTEFNLGEMLYFFGPKVVLDLYRDGLVDVEVREPLSWPLRYTLKRSPNLSLA